MSEHKSASHLQVTEPLNTITSIRQAVKKLDHVNIDLDGKYWINIDKNELLKHDIFKGKQIDEQQKAVLEEVAQDNKLMDKVFNYISLRPRSIKEIRDYLIYRREVEVEKAQQIISDLIDRNYISDEKFAHWYVDNRLAAGVHGINKIKSELSKKGVAKQVIENVLRGTQDEESFAADTKQKIISYTEKASKQIRFKDKYDFKRKLVARLQSRGFTYDQIHKALKNQLADPEVTD
jgi:regulatory protein